MDTGTLPPLNWLRAFEASARHLSFTAAAGELNMTQSAVSQQMRSLEQFLGRALFVRRPRTLQLTDAGLAYLPVVQEAFSTLSSGTRMMTGGDRGKVLTVHVNMAFSVFWLAPRLGDLFAAHPWLRLNITTHTWDPDHTASPSDVEIRFGRRLHDRFDAQRLAHETAFPVCTPEVADQMEDWRTANLFDCTGVLANWEAWAGGRGESLPRGKNVHLATTYSVSITAALGGAGLAMAHDTLAASLIEDGRLVRPFPESIAMEEAYYLLNVPEHATTPANRAFAGWVIDRFGAVAG